jgi:hypothetical protein
LRELTLAAFSQATSAKSPEDFGVRVQNQLTAHSESLFGIEKPLAASAPPSTGPLRAENQPASANLLLAKGLKVEYLTRLASDNTDMMVLWPNDDQPTHIFTAVEIDPAGTTSHGKAPLKLCFVVAWEATRFAARLGAHWLSAKSSMRVGPYTKSSIQLT